MKNSKPEKKQVDGFKVIGIGCLVLFAMIYLYIPLIWPVYSAFRKEYKTEEKLVKALDRYVDDAFYPEKLTAELTEPVYQAVMDGRNRFSKPEGYEVSGIRQVADQKCRLEFYCEKTDRQWEPALTGLTYRDIVSNQNVQERFWSLSTMIDDLVYRLDITMPDQKIGDLSAQEQELLRTEFHEMWYQIIDGHLEKQQ